VEIIDSEIESVDSGFFVQSTILRDFSLLGSDSHHHSLRVMVKEMSVTLIPVHQSLSQFLSSKEIYHLLEVIIDASDAGLNCKKRVVSPVNIVRYKVLSDSEKGSIYDVRGEAGLSEAGGMGRMDPQVRYYIH
jgi:hypothetical protein